MKHYVTNKLQSAVTLSVLYAATILVKLVEYTTEGDQKRFTNVLQHLIR